jgi:hypothetical protein
MNDLPLAINGSAMPFLFDDDTSLIVMDKKLDIIDTKESANLQQFIIGLNQIYYLLIF